jgi:hypothetical protein
MWHGSTKRGLTIIKAHKAKSYPELEKVVFGTMNMSFAGVMAYNGSDIEVWSFNAYRDRENFLVHVRFNREFLLKDRFPFSLYQLDDYSWKDVKEQVGSEYVKQGDVKVIRELKFDSWWNFIHEQKNIKLHKVG